MERLLYVKDWHLWRESRRLYPELAEPGNQSKGLYEIPLFFENDWLEYYCFLETQDDYRFVYLGSSSSSLSTFPSRPYFSSSFPLCLLFLLLLLFCRSERELDASSCRRVKVPLLISPSLPPPPTLRVFSVFSPVHPSFLSRSFSWSYNVVGKKEWLFFPPRMEKELANKYLLSLSSSSISSPFPPQLILLSSVLCFFFYFPPPFLTLLLVLLLLYLHLSSSSSLCLLRARRGEMPFDVRKSGVDMSKCITVFQGEDEAIFGTYPPLLSLLFPFPPPSLSSSNSSSSEWVVA